MTTRQATWAGAAGARRLVAGELAILGALALGKLLLHLLTNGRYGYHRDELYFIACGERLAFGYVDQPPLTPFLARLASVLFGESLPGLRLFPALAGALVVLLAGLTARQFGGGRFAQGLAAATVLAAPLYLGANGLLQPVTFDQLAWTLCSFLLIRLLTTGDPRLWLAIGFVTGLGLLNKHTMLLYGLGLAAGLLLTPARRQLRGRWPWLGGALALSLLLPHLLWQHANGWPTIEFLRAHNALARGEESPAKFLVGQIIMIGPLALPVWLAGLRWLFSPPGAAYRALGWLYLTVLLTLLLLNGKPYYLAPAYPPLLAAGAVAIERWLRRHERVWARPVLAGALVLGGLVLTPLVLPVLPPEAVARSRVYELNEDMAEQFGWEELVGAVAAAHRGLPTEERGKAAILTGNYGEAGAIERLGRAHGLPRPISGHNNYALWGPGDATAEAYITVGLPRPYLETLFDEVEQVGIVTNRYGIDNEEYGQPVHVCRRPRRPLDELWPQIKHYTA